MKKVLSVVGFIILGLMAFLYFLIIKFPFDTLQHQVFAIAEQRTGLRYSLSSVKPDLFPPVSFIFRDFTIADGPTVKLPKGISPLFFPTLRTHLYPLSMLRGDAPFSAEGELLNGDFLIKGELTPDRTSLSGLKGKFEALRFEQFPVTQDIAITFGLSSDFDLKGNLADPRGVSGTLQTTVQKLSTTKIFLFNIELPPLTLGDVKVDCVLEMGDLSIKQFELGDASSDVSGNVTGRIRLATPLIDSNVNLRAKFKFSEKLAEKLDFLLPLLAQARGSDGFYQYELVGPLSSVAPTPVP